MLACLFVVVVVVVEIVAIISNYCHSPVLLPSLKVEIFLPFAEHDNIKLSSAGTNFRIIRELLNNKFCLTFLMEKTSSNECFISSVYK